MKEKEYDLQERFSESTEDFNHKLKTEFWNGTNLSIGNFLLDIGYSA